MSSRGRKVKMKPMIFGSEATIEDLIKYNLMGFEFVVEDGVITNVIRR